MFRFNELRISGGSQMANEPYHTIFKPLQWSRTLTYIQYISRRCKIEREEVWKGYSPYWRLTHSHQTSAK